MENASKALLIAGAILLAILIIAIGMYIYNSAQSTVNNSMTSMTTQELEAFNSNFTSYEGSQSGSNVKALIGRLIANANTYTDESAKVPGVLYWMSNGTEGEDAWNGSTDSKLGDSDSTWLVKADTKANRAKADKIGSSLRTKDGSIDEYVNGLSQLRNNITNKHEYWIDFVFNNSGMITLVNISFNQK